MHCQNGIYFLGTLNISFPEFGKVIERMKERLLSSFRDCLVIHFLIPALYGVKYFMLV